eukprot:g899.t2
MASDASVKSTMLMAVFTSIMAACPFYAIIAKLEKPDLETFVPCNDSPCNFQRLFTGAGIPGTAPDVLGVQNGIARPVVTGRSGEEMQAYLHIAQLVDLQREGPEAALRWWEKTTLRYRILVCGGDGTVGWVLGGPSARIWSKHQCTKEQLDLSYIPPLAILPLGTGNDLARTFGWGGGYTGSSVLPLLQQVGRAHDKRPSFLPGGSQPPRERKTLTMSNYFGIGVDAAVALDFHQMRERRPEWFWSRLVNKLWYFRTGRVKISAQRAERVDIPPSLEGVIILNIPSFGGGSDLWGRAEDEETEQCESDSDSTAPSVSSVNWNSSGAPRRQSMQDGQLEVVGVHGALQLGASQVGLYKAQRLAQGSHIKVTTKVALPTEVDGEPSWFAKDGVIEISHRGQAFMLVNSKETSHAVATDVVDWALHHKIINLEQRHRMLKEIAQRAGARHLERKPSTWTLQVVVFDTVSPEEAVSTLSARYRSKRDVKAGLENLTRRSQRRWIEAVGVANTK